MRPRLAALTLALLAAACVAEERAPDTSVAMDTSCFGGRVLSFQDLVAEVVIPAGEDCASGSFQVVFTRGPDTLTTLTETRTGTVGFIGTADVNGDGRGEFFVATHAAGADARGELYAYTEGPAGIARMRIAPLDSAQVAGYAGHDRFGFGGADQLVRAFPRGDADTAWFAYSYADAHWRAIARPDWLR
jgi:hypothetical protein